MDTKKITRGLILQFAVINASGNCVSSLTTWISVDGFFLNHLKDLLDLHENGTKCQYLPQHSNAKVVQNEQNAQEYTVILIKQIHPPNLHCIRFRDAQRYGRVLPTNPFFFFFKGIKSFPFYLTQYSLLRYHMLAPN